MSDNTKLRTVHEEPDLKDRLSCSSGHTRTDDSEVLWRQTLKWTIILHCSLDT
jgi:hypothetical protein